MHTGVTLTLTFFVSLMLFHLSFLFCHVVCIAGFLYSVFIVATTYSWFSCVLIASGVAILAFG